MNEKVIKFFGLNVKTNTDIDKLSADEVMVIDWIIDNMGGMSEYEQAEITEHLIWNDFKTYSRVIEGEYDKSRDD